MHCKCASKYIENAWTAQSQISKPSQQPSSAHLGSEKNTLAQGAAARAAAASTSIADLPCTGRTLPPPGRPPPPARPPLPLLVPRGGGGGDGCGGGGIGDGGGGSSTCCPCTVTLAQSTAALGLICLTQAVPWPHAATARANCQALAASRLG